MLRVTYEAADDLQPGRLVDIEEDRGLIRVRIDQTLQAPDYTAALNTELARFLTRAEWFQLWKDQIVSPKDVDSPVRVVYQLDEFGELEFGDVVEIREHKGLVRILVYPDADVDQFVSGLNPAIRELLDGGQWFQHWRGEIVDMTSPETMSRI
jgi:hypothetical protein